jgi:Cof subfamily protein (haloacid dehalogenase superfamily)
LANLASPHSAPRLLATDLDGTLLRPDGSVSPRTAAALAAARAAGIEVVFVTGRTHRRVAHLAGLAGAHGTAICVNGASVVDVKTQTLLEQHGMSAPLATVLIARLRASLGPAARFATKSVAGIAREHGYTYALPVPPGSPITDRIEDVLPDTTLKLLVRTDEAWTMQHPDEFTARITEAIGALATATHSGVDGLGEISAPGVTKASTLAAWAAARGIVPAQVWAVGDAPNDLPMLAWAGRAFAVANAHRDVLAAASHTLPSNADDGVATLLERCAAAEFANETRHRLD